MATTASPYSASSTGSNAFYDLPPIADDQARPGSRDYEIIQWCEERLRRGIRFVESQIGYDKIDLAIRFIFDFEKSSSASFVPGPKPLSATRANLVAKIAEDLTAMLTDTRYFWDYTSSNPKYQNQARIFNKLAELWYTDRLIDLRIGDVIRFYTIAGTGFAHLFYSRRLDDMMLEAVDPRMVFPVDPISYHTVQDAVGVIIRKARTPEYFREEYGKIVPAETGAGAMSAVFGWLTRIIDSPAEKGGPLSKKASADTPIPHTPTIYENTLYLDDKRVNETGKPVFMGKWSEDKKQPLTPWSYEVKPGAPLYPFKRMIVWANGVLGYDGPNPYWHAQFPVIKFTLNPWPNSWFGKAPLWDCLPLNSSLNGLLRVIDDHAAQVAQPGMVADRNVARSEINKFDTRLPGYKIKTNMASGKGINIINPPPLDQSLWEHVRWIQDMMQKLSGTADPSAMASLAQIPSDDTIDTIMKAMTPGVRLRSRILEGCYKELASQVMFLMCEFDSLTKRIAILGQQGVTPEDYDFDPRTMIPDDVPDGEPGDIAGTENAVALDNPRPLFERARMMLQAIACKFDPSSLLNSAAQQELMKYFLLAKMGYVSVFTLLEKMGFQNFAPPTLIIPPDEIGRLALQQSLGIGMIANAAGRKDSNAAPPAMGQTGNGPTITTS